MATVHNSPAMAQMTARIRCRGMDVAGVKVLDLSLAGCMIETGAWLPREEQRVLVGLPALPSLPAAVLWVENGRAGILFDELLGEVVFEHLLASHSLGGRD